MYISVFESAQSVNGMTYSNGKLQDSEGDIPSLNRLCFHSQNNPLVQQHRQRIEIQRHLDRARHIFSVENIFHIAPREKIFPTESP